METDPPNQSLAIVAAFVAPMVSAAADAEASLLKNIVTSALMLADERTTSMEVADGNCAWRSPRKRAVLKVATSPAKTKRQVTRAVATTDRGPAGGGCNGGVGGAKHYAGIGGGDGGGATPCADKVRPREAADSVCPCAKRLRSSRRPS